MFEESLSFPEQYIRIYIHFKNGYGANYEKANHDRSFDFPARGNLTIDTKVLQKTRSLEDFLKAFNGRTVYALEENGLIDAEKCMDNIYAFYGPDYEIDLDSGWFNLGNGMGLPAEVAAAYYKAYLEDLDERECFLNLIEYLCEHSEPDYITICRLGECMDYDDEVEYEINLETGEFKEIKEEEGTKYEPGIDYETSSPEDY